MPGRTDVDTVIGIRRPEVIVLLSLLPRPDRGSGTARAPRSAWSRRSSSRARRHGVAKVVAALPAAALYGHPAAQTLPVKEGALIPRGVNGVVAAVDDRSARDRTAIVHRSSSRPWPWRPCTVRANDRTAASWRPSAPRSTRARPPVIHGDGRQTRDFVFVDDVVDALVRAAERGGGLVINIGTGEQTSMRELWDHVGRASGLVPASAPARPDDLARFAVSPVRARIHLAWSPWTDSRRGSARLRSGQLSAFASLTAASVVVGERSCPGGRRHDRRRARRSASRRPRRRPRGGHRPGRSTRAEAIGCVQTGDADDGRLVPQLDHHAVGRALQCRASDDRRHGDDTVTPRGEECVDVGRVSGSGRSTRAGSTVRSRRRRRARAPRRASAAQRGVAVEAHRRDGDVVAQPDEVVLERDLTVFHGVDGRRRCGRRTSAGSRSGTSHARRISSVTSVRRGPLGQAGGAVQMGGEITIAEVEPAGRGARAGRADGFVPCRATPSPATTRRRAPSPGPGRSRRRGCR